MVVDAVAAAGGTTPLADTIAVRTPTLTVQSAMSATSGGNITIFALGTTNAGGIVLNTGALLAAKNLDMTAGSLGITQNAGSIVVTGTLSAANGSKGTVLLTDAEALVVNISEAIEIAEEAETEAAAEGAAAEAPEAAEEAAAE